MMAKEDYFKYKEKHVVDRLPDGVPAIVEKKGDSVSIRSRGSIDERLFKLISDKDYKLRGHICGEVFYARDVYYHGDEEFEGSEWHDRYSALSNDFDWTHTIRMSKPIVITSKEDLETAVKMFEMVPDSRGATVWDYDAQLEFTPRRLENG